LENNIYLSIFLLFLFRYWQEEAEKVFPHNKSVKKLRDKISRAKEGAADDDHEADVTAELNGNGDSNESEDGTFWYIEFFERFSKKTDPELATNLCA
jgi:hypothetical protein